MRTTFINQLVEEARHNDKIFLIVGDLGYNVVEPFAKEFPDRYLNPGIAEQNMMGIAAGLAMEGFIPFIYSIANFPTMRCIEQIRNEACYHDLNVNIVSVGGGFAYGSLGASHQATEELGMMRILPNMNVCAPGDPAETRQIVKLAVSTPHPFYIRLGKAGEPEVHSQMLDDVQLGDLCPVLQNGSTVVISTGAMLKYAYDFIQNNGLDVALYSMPFLKPINREHVRTIAEKYDRIITIEEHQLAGGMSSALLETMNDLCMEGSLEKITPVRRIAIPDTFYSIAGSQQFLRDTAGVVLKKEYFE